MTYYYKASAVPYTRTVRAPTCTRPLPIRTEVRTGKYPQVPTVPPGKLVYIQIDGIYITDIKPAPKDRHYTHPTGHPRPGTPQPTGRRDTPPPILTNHSQHIKESTGHHWRHQIRTPAIQSARYKRMTPLSWTILSSRDPPKTHPSGHFL